MMTKLRLAAGLSAAFITTGKFIVAVSAAALFAFPAVLTSAASEDGGWTEVMDTIHHDEEGHYENQKTGEAEVAEKTYSVIGNFKGDTNWTIDYDLVKGADGLYTVVIDGVDAGNYEFKVRENHDWTMSYPNSNYKITVDADGSAVTVTFNAETKEITAVAGTTKVNAVKAEKAGVKYNLAGRKVNAQYKGIVIENGRKVLK